MHPFPRFSNRRRALQLGRYGLRHGFKVFDRLNRANLFLARQFSNVEIDCNVCGARSKVWYEMRSVKELKEHRVGYLRETLECLNCLSRTRYRVMGWGILAECRERFGITAPSIAALAPRIGHVDILDTDAFSPVARKLEGNPAYKVSSYVPDRPAGPLEDGKTYNVDLQAIPFPDKSFDIMLSSDVMEHVRDFARANAEIFRCLKPGGAHIFTVPFWDPQPATRTLIHAAPSGDVYLEPPQLHGDDHLSGRIPAYRVFGWDILDELRALGFEARAVRVRAAQNGVYDETYFVARRPA